MYWQQQQLQRSNVFTRWHYTTDGMQHALGYQLPLLLACGDVM